MDGRDRERASGDLDALLRDAPAPTAPVYPRGPVPDEWWQSRPAWVHTAAHWAAPAAVVGVAAATRLIGLGHPAEIVFDETYYVKDAWSLWNLGYESTWPDDANTRFAAGESNIFTGESAFVVHPPLGKWIIALGMAALGPANPAGWRLSMAILGILAVILVMVVAKRLTGSLAIAVIAGGLLAIDGNAIVMSRIGILDNALMFLVLVGFVCIVMDRGWAQQRLDTWLLARDRIAKGPGWGPALWWRPWLIAAGAALGAATAVKWSGLWFLAAFGLLTIASDVLMRRASGVDAWFTGTVLKQGPVSALLMLPIAAVVHLSSWLGWFRSTDGYHRQWADGDGAAWTGALAWVPRDLQSWWHFQVVSYQYHVSESPGELLGGLGGRRMRGCRRMLGADHRPAEPADLVGGDRGDRVLGSGGDQVGSMACPLCADRLPRRLGTVAHLPRAHHVPVLRDRDRAIRDARTRHGDRFSRRHAPRRTGAAHVWARDRRGVLGHRDRGQHLLLAGLDWPEHGAMGDGAQMVAAVLALVGQLTEMRTRPGRSPAAGSGSPRRWLRGRLPSA